MAGSTFENDLMKLIYQGTAIANIADNASSSPLTNVYASLATADPGLTGDQTTSEVSYTGYARVAVARTTGGFTISGNNLITAANIVFGQRTDNASTTALWLVIGTASSGTGKILARFPLGSSSNPLQGNALASSDVLTIPNNYFVIHNQIAFKSNANLTLPGGITEGTVYFVLTVTGNTFQISTTDGGSAVNITTDGSFVAELISGLIISQNVIPQVDAGTLSQTLNFT